jgi:hypothetical protein
MKTNDIPLIFLLLGLFAFGMYMAIKNYGYIAFLSGIFCGQIYANLYFKYRRRNVSIHN